MRKPAVLGGPPAFRERVPISRPALPETSRLLPPWKEILASGQITNGKWVRELERKAEARLGVSHAVAVSSCTAGLMLVLRALRIEGEVILPSFTFFATAHAVVWNGLQPVFADCERETFNVDPDSVERRITAETRAIVGVHIFGNPCDAGRLESVARRHRLPLLFDSAHALGAHYRGRMVGSFGSAEVFSLSPTKTVVAGEGGIVTTDDGRLADTLRAARDYGNAGDYDPVIVGLSARMGELNGVLGVASLRELGTNIGARRALAARYREVLESVPGIRFQQIAPGCESSLKDFALVVDEEQFGLGRDELHIALSAENISTRKYFSPPVHMQSLYAGAPGGEIGELPVTEEIASRVLCLPMYAHMGKEVAARVGSAVREIQEHAGAIRGSGLRGAAGETSEIGRAAPRPVRI